MADIIVIEGKALQMLLEDLRVPNPGQINRLSVANDEGYVKTKVNSGIWTPGVKVEEGVR